MRTSSFLLVIFTIVAAAYSAENPYPCWEPNQMTRMTPGDSCPPESGSVIYDDGLRPLPGHQPLPAYPQAGSEFRGELKVSVCVGRDGVPLRWNIWGWVPPEVQKAIDEVMPEWRFSPALCHGQPVIGIALIDLYFSPPDDPYPCYELYMWPPDDPAYYDTGPDPLPGHRPQPKYPTAALESEEEDGAIRGPVDLEVCVSKEGRVDSWRPFYLLPPPFSKAIDKTLQEWRFSPAIRSGKPVADCTEVTLTFTRSQASADSSAARRLLADRIMQERGLPSNRRDPCPVDGDLLPAENRPKPLPGHQPAPVYPDYMETKLGGWVSVAICVDKEGFIREWEHTGRTMPELAQELDIVLPFWRFSPGMCHGQPVGVRTSLRFFFTPPPAPPDTTPDGLAKASLRERDPKIQIEKKKRQGWLTLTIRGQIPPDAPQNPLEAAYNFLESYRSFFALSDPRVEIGFAPDAFPFSQHKDSTVSETPNGTIVAYHFSQLHAGVPVLGSSIEVAVRKNGSVLTSISAMMLPDICVHEARTVDEQCAAETVQPLLSGPDRHCTASQPQLWATRMDGEDYFVWIINLGCGPAEDQVFGGHWGEQVWVDAHTGDVLKKMGTWIE